MTASGRRVVLVIELRTRLEQDPGWHVHDLPTGHNAMREAPEAVAELLLSTKAP